METKTFHLNIYIWHVKRVAQKSENVFYLRVAFIYYPPEMGRGEYW